MLCAHYYNERPYTGCLINNRNVFLTALEAGSPNYGAQGPAHGETCRKPPSPLHIEGKMNNPEFHTLLLPVTACAGRRRGSSRSDTTCSPHRLSWRQGGRLGYEVPEATSTSDVFSQHTCSHDHKTHPKRTRACGNSSSFLDVI